MVTPKHIATFLLGAAAGAAIMKYNSMTKEEQDELVNNLKSKADQAQGEAVAAIDKLQDFFEDLKDKGITTLKEQMGNAEQMVQDFMKNNKANPSSESPNTSEPKAV
jgi:hypothetical protein